MARRKFIKGLNKDVMYCATGGACGIIAPEAIRIAINPMFVDGLPGINTILPGVWSQPSVFFSLVAGGLSAGAGLLTNTKFSPFLVGFGMVAVSYALVQGFTSKTPVARFRGAGVRPSAFRRPVSRTAMPQPRVKVSNQITRGRTPRQTSASKFASGPQDNRNTFQETKTGISKITTYA